MSEDTRLTISALGGTVVTVLLSLASAMWLNVLDVVLRGTAFEIFAFPAVAVIIFGVGGVWYVATRTIYRLLGGNW